MVEQVKRVTLTSRAFRNDQLPLLYKLPARPDRLRHVAADELGRRGGRDRRQGGAQVGLHGQGHPEGPGRDHRLRRQLPRPHDDHRQLLHRRAVPRRLRPAHAGLPDHPLRRRRRPRGRDHAEHRAPSSSSRSRARRASSSRRTGFLKQAEALCRANNVLFICDEIQAGPRPHRQALRAPVGGRPPRHGHHRARRSRAATTPSRPCSADKDVLGVFKPGDHGSTFGGNPLACAVARAALQVLIDEKLVERSAELGEYFLAKLRGHQEPGRQGGPRPRPVDRRRADRRRPGPTASALMQEGMLCKETHDHVIRLAPPLVITREEIDWAVEKLQEGPGGAVTASGRSEEPPSPESRVPSPMSLRRYETHPHRHHGSRRARLPQLQRRLPRQSAATTSSRSPRPRSRTSTAASYPASLAGQAVPEGHPDPRRGRPASSIIREHKVQEVVFAYSDVPYNYVMDRASIANAAGADFKLLGAEPTMLKSTKPVISVCAVRTGLRQEPDHAPHRGDPPRGRPEGGRHPPPDAATATSRSSACSASARIADLKKHDCTIEEIEEYEPHIVSGTIIYAGVDYGDILAQAQEEADVILWDGGNNDTPFYKPDLHIVVADPLRVGQRADLLPRRDQPAHGRRGHHQQGGHRRHRTPSTRCAPTSGA
ncbi:MAG: aminotransferase class III-fold pyridoxal phosphate-dependent enzyme [Rhodopseudomonas palustris]|nr:aminotransferase class III-fold pyridoxal phosphate-dependent enzyme [Rhodopseudomonas palustris]